MENKITAKEFRNILIFLIPILLFIFFTIWQNDKKLANCSRISVGTLIRYEKSFEAGLDPIISYQVNGRIYSQITSKIEGQIGTRYFIKYYCKDPKILETIKNIPVPDSLKYIPTNGWEKVPYGLDRKGK